MKKILILLSLALAVIACEDDLNLAPISEPSAANFYRNTDDFELAVNGVYHSIKDYSAIHFYLSEIRSDNVYAPGTGVREWNPINNFDRTLATNPNMSTAWDVCYRGIYRANMVLDLINVENVPDADVRDRMIGEVKFLRALFYLDLVRFFGEVPVFDRAYTPTEALEIPRQPVEEVYELIEADLKDAIDLLPVSYDRAGKATTNAAKALLAKVYLTMSGPTYGIKGPGLGVNRYTDALNLLNEVITNGPYGWVSDYASIFSYDNQNNPDIVFDIQSINDGDTGNRGIGTILPTLMYNESFGRANLPFAGGVPGDGAGHITPSDNLVASYGETDVRPSAIMLMSYIDPTGNPVNEPMYTKFLSLDHIPADRFNWGINFPIIRYTDVLLMKAEALIQTQGDQQVIDQLVNDVRIRAGVGEVENVDLDMLLEERRREFAAEGLRWHDLVRTGKVLEVMNNWITLDDSAGKINEVIADFILYPLHQNQLEVKKGLYYQNEPY